MSIYLDHVNNNVSASTGSLSINGSTPQPLHTILTSISGLSTSTTGTLKLTNGVASLETNTYLTGNQTITFSGDASGSGSTSVILTLANSGATAGTYKSLTINAKGLVTGGTNPTTLSGFGITDAQSLNANLTSVAGLATNLTGIVKFTNGVASIDTGTYLSSNQTVTFSGDATGSGTTAITLTLANSGATAGTYGSATQVGQVVVDAKGRITSASNLTVTPAWSSITSKPTTLTGFGITDAQGLNANLTSLSALSTSTTGLVKLTNGTASLDTSSYLVSGGALGTPTSGDLTNATNAVGYGLKTATTVVSVSAATAPTVGQALVATSSTTATWQTVSVGSSLPTQTGNSGKYLTTDGTNPAWATVASGLISTAVKTANYTTAGYELVRANTTAGSFTVTFPTSPTDGAQIGVIDVAKTFGAYPLTLVPGAGTTIEGDTAVVLDVSGAYVSFVYTSALTNWRLLSIPFTTNGILSTGSLVPTSIKTSAYTASGNDLVRCNTSGGAFSVTLPGSPLDGTIIGFVDINNSFATNNLTILPTTGKTIEGDVTSYVLDMSSIYVSFIYSSTTSNWRLLETPTASPTASIGKSIAMSIAFGG